MASTVNRKASTSAKRGVMSLKTTPGLGKSGMSRMWSLSQPASFDITSTLPLDLPPAALLPGTGAGAATAGGSVHGNGAGPARHQRRAAVVELAVSPGSGAGPSTGHGRRRCRRERTSRRALAHQAGTDGRIAWLALLEDGQDGRGDEDRGVGAGDEADEEGEPEFLQCGGAQHVGADAEHAGDGEDGDQAGVDRAHQYLVHGQVDGVCVG